MKSKNRLFKTTIVPGLVGRCVMTLVILGIKFSTPASCQIREIEPGTRYIIPQPGFINIKKVSGSVRLQHLGGENVSEYCGHRFTATFESNNPNMRLHAIVFDFRPSQNTCFDDMILTELPPCDAYGVLSENFYGFFIYNYPGGDPLVHIYPDNPNDPETGIKSGDRVIGRMKLKNRTDGDTRPNAPDLRDAIVILQFSDGITCETTLKETGNFFMVSGKFVKYNYLK